MYAYEIFELENGVPTYGYELGQAVTDGFLVDFMSVESKLKFIEQGIVYDDLSDEDKMEYEDTFEVRSTSRLTSTVLSTLQSVRYRLPPSRSWRTHRRL